MAGFVTMMVGWGWAIATVMDGAQVSAQATTVHLGSEVVMIRYEGEWPDLIGTKAAAIVTDGPFVCPEGNEHEGGECVNLRFFVRSPHDGENGDPVHCPALGAGCEGWYVKTGMDFKFAVWHDPTGKEPRSWHVWGEAEGEN